nr:unnamed protein product [Callosobruchus analis]
MRKGREELLNANHVLLLGATEETEEYVETSAIKSSPHEIKGKLIINESKSPISLAAVKLAYLGLLSIESLMPFIALLGFILFSAENVDNLYFYDFRQNIYLLVRLSTTDTRCYWSNKKKAVEQHYEATPILETECYKKLVTDKEPLTSAQKKGCFDLLLQCVLNLV